MVGTSDASTANNGAHSSSHRIQVLITVQEEKEQHAGREVIREVQQDFEVVEVDGFVFKRRKTEHVEDAAAGAAASAGTADGNENGEGSTQQQQLEEQQQPSFQLPQQQHKALVQACQQSCQEQLLGAMKASDGQQQQQHALPLLERLHAEFMRVLDLTLPGSSGEEEEEGQQQQAVAVPQAPERDGQALQQELAARKRVLQARLAKFKQEEQEWLKLAEADAQVPPQLASTCAGPPQQRAGSVTLPLPPTGLQATPAGAEGQRPSEEEGGPPHTAECGGCTAALRAQLQAKQAALHHRCVLQVEALCAAVKQAEALVEYAEGTCLDIQNKYHHEKFRTFPHVDSPARLIRDLVQARQ